MNWISDWALPKIKGLFGGPRETPDNLWHKCPSCEQMIFHRDLERNLHVCPSCGHHMRMSAAGRIKATLDEDSAHQGRATRFSERSRARKASPLRPPKQR